MANKLSLYGLVFSLVFILSIVSLVLVSDSSNLMTGYATYTSENSTIYQCGTITESGTYHLNQSIALEGDFKIPPPCLSIEADNVVLQGNGFSILYGFQYVAISSKGYSGLYITNVTLGTGKRGLHLDSVTNSTFSHLTIENLSTGIYSYSSTNNFSNVTIRWVDLGVDLISSNNNDFTDVTIQNTSIGFDFSTSNENVLNRASILDSEKGIFFSYSNNNEIYLLDLNNLTYGVNITNSCSGTHLKNIYSVDVNKTILDTTDAATFNYLSYDLPNTKIMWTDSSFLQNLSLQGDLILGTTIGSGKNEFFLDENEFTGNIYSSANITFFNTGAQNFTNPVIEKNSAYCADCINMTSLYADTVTFNTKSVIGLYEFEDFLVDVVDDADGFDVSTSPDGQWLMRGRTYDQKYTQPTQINFDVLNVSWSQQIRDASFGVVADDSQIIVAGEKTKIFAFSHNGTLSWVKDLGYEVVASPTMDTTGAVYVLTAPFSFKILGGGELRWTHELGKSPNYASFVPVVDIGYSKDKSLNVVHSIYFITSSLYSEFVYKKTGLTNFESVLQKKPSPGAIFASLPRAIVYVNERMQEKKPLFTTISVDNRIYYSYYEGGLLQEAIIEMFEGYYFKGKATSIRPMRQLICHPNNGRFYCDDELDFVTYHEGTEMLYVDGDSLKSTILPSSYVRASTSNHYLPDSAPLADSKYMLSENSLLAGTNFTYYYLSTKDSGFKELTVLSGSTFLDASFETMVGKTYPIQYSSSIEPVLLQDDVLLYAHEKMLVAIDPQNRGKLLFSQEFDYRIQDVIVTADSVIVLTQNNLVVLEEQAIQEPEEVVEEPLADDVFVDVSFMSGCAAQDSVVVVASEGLVIQGASVSFTSENVSVVGTTDSQGMFSTRLPQGTYLLEISTSGFDDFSQTVTVGTCQEAYTPEELEELIDSILDSFITQADGHSGTTTHMAPYIPQKSIRFSSSPKSVVKNVSFNQTATTSENASVLFFNSSKAFSLFMLILVLLLIAITLYVRHKVHALRQQQGKLK
ncbi:MAG: carboxypeptidase regulatory-like domain-containing protein [Candidatus Woesearchaeota archaeon]